MKRNLLVPSVVSVLPLAALAALVALLAVPAAGCQSPTAHDPPVDAAADAGDPTDAAPLDAEAADADPAIDADADATEALDAAIDAPAPTDAAVDAAVDGPGPDAGPLADPFAALVALTPTCSADGWCWRTPQPTGNDYSRVYATAPDNLWLVGQHGTVMQWNGHAWIRHRPPVPAGQLTAQYPSSIAGRGPADMWMVYGATVVRWDGATWTIRDVLPPDGLVAFSSVWQAPNGDVWVTLNNGTVKRSVGGGAFQAIGTGCNCFLGSIWGTASDDFFITTLPAGILHYDGHLFTRVYTGPLVAGSYQGTRDDVWVSGGDGALLHWNGLAWTPRPTGLGANWYVFGLARLAADDLWWWASRGSAMSALLHWDGATLTTTYVDTADVPSLYGGAIVDGRWWLVGAEGAVYTRAGPATIRPIVAPSPLRGAQAVWGSGPDDLYFATGGQVRHWNGTTTATLPIEANQISGIRQGGVTELFATGFELTPLSDPPRRYIANGFHWDGGAWRKTAVEIAPLDQHRYFTRIHTMGPGEAMAVGYGGLAFHFSGGEWHRVTTNTTADLMGVWGPDPDHLWFTGTQGTLLEWKRANPGVATPDPTFPATTADLGPIDGADGITWIGVTNAALVLKRTGTGPWMPILSAGTVAAGLVAISATDVVVSSSGQSRLARWNGTQFVAEDTASGVATPLLFKIPGGPTLAGWHRGFVEHP